MKHKILFRESLVDGDEISICSKYFDVIKSRMQIQKNDFIIPRYSAVPFAKEFFEDINFAKAKSINSYNQFKYISDLKNYVSDLGDLTPKTWSADDGIYHLPDNKSFILKGETNSKKFLWDKMMFAKTKEDCIEIHGNLLRDGLVGDQSIYIREYVPLKTFKISYHNLPITNEYRFFIAYNHILSGAYYWSNYYEELKEEGYNLSPEQVPINFLNHVMARVGKNSNAYVIDVAETDSGDWIVVELNAFEQSGLSQNDPEKLYSNLKKVISL